MPEDLGGRFAEGNPRAAGGLPGIKHGALLIKGMKALGKLIEVGCQKVWAVVTEDMR